MDVVRDTDSVTVLIPTLNEEQTIGTVLAGFVAEGFDHFLVVDGNSSDQTRAIARDQGARVITQTGSGKGQAVIEAVSEVETDIVLLVDGDATYRPEDAQQLLDPVLTGSVDHVIGNRFADMDPKAMSSVNKMGNSLINRTFRFVHGCEFEDILSGYRAFTTSSFLEINPSTNGFGIETALAVGCCRERLRTRVVPISYLPRPDGSSTKLRPIRDGSVILITLYRLTRTNNPLFFFGSVGILSMIFGGLLGGFVGYRWFMMGISHEVLAVVSSFGILLGVQLIMFGLLSDMIITLHREQLRQMNDDGD